MRIVGEAHEAEPAVRAGPHQRPCRVAELATHRRFAPAREPQLAVERGREARALGLQGAIGVAARLPSRPRTLLTDLAPPPPAHHPAETEEAPRVAEAPSGSDHR